ncbi:uncharacterized protein LOC131605901 [Vicia villosa]|uniref:uncharacterized protein LOC131605901 n=1 Tax=Vicia villosa TaxID=3911 RepID=UPI00273A8E6F|nr:uncharacterized protein LOC131605901 [Vicia villosa]
MGCSHKWLSWMEGTVFFSSISILVNGSSTVEFEASRRLRQGDLLSPFLFLLVAEGLTIMMRNAVSSGCLKGFQVSSDISFEMLQLADDTVLICDGSKENLWCIKAMLRGFELVSGLCINLNKSKLFGVHLEEHVLLAASSFLGCQVGKLPFVFLGIPVGGNHRRKDFLSFLISKLKKRLSGWSGKHLSLGGKVTLLNSVLNSILIFIFFFYKDLKYVLDEIVKIQKDFLLGQSDRIRKVCWDSWEKI